MKKIRINFTGLSIRSTFDPNNNPILDILKKHYDVEVCDDPDYVICGVLYPGGYFSNGMYYNYIMDYPCIRIMINGENLIPDFNHVDYAISSYPIEYNDCNCYLPCGVESFTNGHRFFRELQDKDRNYSDDFLVNKLYFASFIASHDSEKNIRGDFFKALNARKRVESVGSFLNNMQDGKRVDWLDGSKIEFQKKCKFALCFESVFHYGFISEKIVEAFYCDTIPIYCGSSNIKDIFNPKAFIDINDFPDFDSAIDRILEIDSNDDLYMEMLRQPIFRQRSYAEQKINEVEAFLCHIFDQPIEKAGRRSRSGTSALQEDFLKRSTERGEKMDVEEIKYVPLREQTDEEIAKDYIKHIPNRMIMKLIGTDRYDKIKRRFHR